MYIILVAVAFPAAVAAFDLGGDGGIPSMKAGKSAANSCKPPFNTKILSIPIFFK